MQERQVTIGEETYPLPKPFLVLATQNPVEQEGTYPLPEAQVDRFMLKVKVGYPTKAEEIQIMKRIGGGQIRKSNKIITPEEILKCREIVNRIFVDDKLYDYITDLVFATREPASFRLKELDGLIEYGASPRASLFLVQGARAYAFLRGRGYVTPQDIKSIGLDIMRHRVLISYEAEARNMTSDDLLLKIFDRVDVP